MTTEPTVDAGKMPGQDDPGSIHIGAENLPPGIKEGDTLRCTGMDESGCTFALESKSNADGSMDDYMSGLRESMSPRNGKTMEDA